MSIEFAVKDPSHYDEVYYEANHQDGDRLALKFFSRLMKRHLKRGKILEYGCGSGYFINKFKEDFYETFAHDISPYVLKVAKKNSPKTKIVKNTKKELKARSMDGVAALHLLEHIEDPNTVLEEFSRVLKKNGILFATVPNMESYGRTLKKDRWFGYRDETHISLLFPKEWRALFDKNGFELITVGSDGMWDVPYVKYAPLIIQKLVFYPSSAVQVLTGRTFLPIRTGENLVLAARKR